MLIFTLLTVGYFAGVVTALVIFPPKVKEIEMQEHDAASVIKTLEKSESSQVAPNSEKDLSF
jgi:hypothetical protein